jgi:hypothetical protein
MSKCSVSSSATSFRPTRFCAPDTGGKSASARNVERTIPLKKEAIAAMVRDLSPLEISESIANTPDIGEILRRLEGVARKRYLADLVIFPMIWALPEELATRLRPIFQAKKMNAAEKATVFEFLANRPISAVEKGCVMLLALTRDVELADYPEALGEAIEVASIFVRQHNYPQSQIHRHADGQTIIEGDGSILVGVLLRQQMF